MIERAMDLAFLLVILVAAGAVAIVFGGMALDGLGLIEFIESDCPRRPAR